jgi:hypothetical protein
MMATTRGQTGGDSRKKGQSGQKAGGSRSSSGAAGTGAPKRTKKADSGAASDAGLRKDLREFVQGNPGGWGHNEWIGLVNLLKERGHDTSDTDAVGMALERERLTLVLERVPGLGPQRVKSIADRYPRIWNLMQAGAEEIAIAANLPRSVAQRVKDALP